MLRSIAHIIHPGLVEPTSDLTIAQPITFATMQTAQRIAYHQVDVQLFYTQYADEAITPLAGFQRTPDLTRSVLTIGRFQQKRKLALLSDILDRLYAATEAEYLIYTNVDIALQPHFYLAVDQLLAQGYDALIINRRTISATFQQVAEIPLMYAQVGEPHPGHDCFIFKRAVYTRYQLGDICIGASRVGAALALNLVYHAEHFQEFTDLHLTFHLGNKQAWRLASVQDYRHHNDAQYHRILAYYQARFPHVQHPFLDRLQARFAKPPRWRAMCSQLRRYF
ncbi:MAG: hypothetical protein KF832_04130 [Caldilineaceae bacterium]|nr:hypothetical protein [Caldilineaceae bacterium]